MSLAQTSKNFKTGIKVLAVVVVVYYVFLLVIIPKTKNVLRKLLPTKNPPNPIYGQLDPLIMQKRAITNQSPRYILDTKNGKLPDDLPNKMSVYKISKGQFSYLAGTEAEVNAAILGYFEVDLVSDLKGDELKWKSIQSGGELTIKKSTGEIKIESNITSKASEYKAGTISETEAKRYASDILSKMKKLDPLYATGMQQVTLGKITNNTLENAFGEKDAQFARVDFFRSVDKYPIFGPDPKEGLIQIILRPPVISNSAFNYPFVKIRLHTVEKNPEASYPIIYPDEAWDEVKKNNGIIVSIVPKGKNMFEPYTPTRVDAIYINKISLGYFEPYYYTPYLQPIYIFEGKFTTPGTTGGDVVIFFPAITKEYIKPINK